MGSTKVAFELFQKLDPYPTKNPDLGPSKKFIRVPDKEGLHSSNGSAATHHSTEQTLKQQCHKKITFKTFRILMFLYKLVFLSLSL